MVEQHNSIYEYSRCNCEDCIYVYKVEVFNEAIITSNEKLFHQYLPEIRDEERTTSLPIIVEHGTMNMLESLHHGVVYGPYHYAMFDPICIAVRIHDSKMLKWLLDYGYTTIFLSNLYNHLIYEDLDMLKLFHKYKLYVDMSEVMRFTLRHLVDSKHQVFPIDADNYTPQSIEYLSYLHDNFPKCAPNYYNWDCVNGRKCYLCELSKERKVESLAECWFLESYEYDSTIQWLPKEIIEDLFELL